MSKSRFFFYLSGAPVWVNLLKTVEFEHQAAFGIADDRSLDALKLTSPDAEVLSFNRLKMGLFDRSRSAPLPSSVTRSGAYLERLQQAYYSLDRLAPAGYIEYQQRRLYLSALGDFLWSYFQLSVPDYGLMTEAPHTAPDLLLAGIGEALGLPTIHFQGSSLAPVARVYQGPKYLPVKVSDSLNADTEAGRLAALESLRGFIQDSIARSIEGKKTSFQEDFDRREVGRAREVWRSFYRPYSLLADERSQAAGWENGRGQWADEEMATIHGVTRNSRTAWLSHKAVLVGSQQMRKQRQLAHSYRAISAKALPAECAVFFLQFEPERTSLPDGGTFSDQLHAVRCAAHAFEGKLPLVVREHPSHFVWTSRGFFVRTPRFYEELASIRNVVLSSTEISHEEILARCKVALTLTGSAGLEVRSQGKPSIALGSAWYQGLPGILSANGEEPLAQFVAEAIGWSDPLNFSLEESLMDLLRDYFIPMAVNPSVRSLFPDAQDDTESLFRLLNRMM